MRALLRVFPRRFRQRYGSEVTELLEQTETTWRDGADLLRTALSLHIENALRAVRRFASGRRTLLALALAAPAGAALSGCTGFASALAIGGCSALGGAVVGSAWAVALAGSQLATRRVPQELR